MQEMIRFLSELSTTSEPIQTLTDLLLLLKTRTRALWQVWQNSLLEAFDGMRGRVDGLLSHWLVVVLCGIPMDCFLKSPIGSDERLI